MFPVGAIFVPFPPKTGTNMLHSLPPQSLNLYTQLSMIFENSDIFGIFRTSVTLLLSYLRICFTVELEYHLSSS